MAILWDGPGYYLKYIILWLIDLPFIATLCTHMANYHDPNRPDYMEDPPEAVAPDQDAAEESDDDEEEEENMPYIGEWDRPVEDAGDTGENWPASSQKFYYFLLK